MHLTSAAAVPNKAPLSEAKQRRRGSWRKKARLCYSKEAECGGKLYAAKLTYFIAKIAKATSPAAPSQKQTQESHVLRNLICKYKISYILTNAADGVSKVKRLYEPHKLSIAF